MTYLSMVASDMSRPVKPLRCSATLWRDIIQIVKKLTTADFIPMPYWNVSFTPSEIPLWSHLRSRALSRLGGEDRLHDRIFYVERRPFLLIRDLGIMSMMVMSISTANTNSLDAPLFFLFLQPIFLLLQFSSVQIPFPYKNNDVAKLKGQAIFSNMALHLMGFFP